MIVYSKKRCILFSVIVIIQLRAKELIINVIKMYLVFITKVRAWYFGITAWTQVLSKQMAITKAPVTVES